MSRSTVSRRLAFCLTGALAAALALSACNRPGDSGDAGGNTSTAALPGLPATLPLTLGAATPPALAPAAGALPAAAPLRTVQVADDSDVYGYADRALGFTDAWGESPPDWSFDYDGVDPWAWQGYDGSLAFAEPVDGGYRYYYYEPGANTPYFIRDADYDYGYANGALAVIYDRDGRVLPASTYGNRLDYAGRYYSRAGDLRRVAYSRPRHPVVAANWTARAPVIAAARARWVATADRNPAWRTYRQANAPKAAAHWRPEQTRRRDDAARFASWRQGDFAGKPPERAQPAGVRPGRSTAPDRPRKDIRAGGSQPDASRAPQRPDQPRHERANPPGRSEPQRDRPQPMPKHAESPKREAPPRAQPQRPVPAHAQRAQAPKHAAAPRRAPVARPQPVHAAPQRPRPQQAAPRAAPARAPKAQHAQPQHAARPSPQQAPHARGGGGGKQDRH